MDYSDVFSFHTFMLPFSVNDKFYKALPLTETAANGMWWKEITYDGHITKEGLYKEVEGQEREPHEEYNRRLTYNEYQYFLPKANKIIFNEAGSFVHNYVLVYNGKRENLGYFSITKTDDKDVNYKYSLNIFQISLLFDEKLGIGVLSFGLECDTDFYSRQIDVFSIINDLGRRTFAASYGYYDKQIITPISPNNIKINIENKSFNIGFNDTNNDKKQILHILMGGDVEEDKENYDFTPILDDRMFTVSAIIDNVWTDKFKEAVNAINSSNTETPSKDEDENVLKHLYEIMFLDSFNNCSCQEKSMRRELIKKHLYTRWNDWGSIYSVTEYSLTLITNKSCPDYLIDNFLTHYADMAKIALLQRAALAVLETEVCNRTSREGMDKNTMGELWEKYIHFQSDLYLPEISHQQQGIEMYDMLRDNLRLKVFKEYIEGMLENLKEIESEKNAKKREEEIERQEKWEKEQDRKINKLTTWLSIIMGISTLIDVMTIVGLGEKIQISLFCGVFVSTIVLIVLVIVSFRLIKEFKTKVNETEKKDNGK